MLTADLLAAHGLELAELPPDVIAAIDELLPPFWSRGNPIDLVATVSDGVPEKIIELVAGCDRVDSVITLALIGSPSSGRAGSRRRDERHAGRPRAARLAGAPPGASSELNERELALLSSIAASRSVPASRS